MVTIPTTSVETTPYESTSEEPTSKKTESDDRKEWLGERIIRILNSGDIIYRDYPLGETKIIEKVIELLKGRELSEETYKAVNEFLDKMETKIKNGKFVFEIHDTIGYFDSDDSPERCDNIDYFLSLIRGLVEYINNPPTELVGFKNEPLFRRKATIAIGGGFNNSNKACGVQLAKIEVVHGGSKSRRRHRRPHKSARKTTRKSKSMYKAKSKTHHRRRHSRVRVRKHKKYTSRRR
jgi:hypothetical protein